jgi:hypothetical protein
LLHSPCFLTDSWRLRSFVQAECFQWRPDADCVPGLPTWSETERSALEHELADVLAYLLRLSTVCGVSLEGAFQRKMELNRAKYDPSQCYGSSAKYTTYEQPECQKTAEPATVAATARPAVAVKLSERQKAPPAPPSDDSSSVSDSSSSSSSSEDGDNDAQLQSPRPKAAPPPLAAVSPMASAAERLRARLAVGRPDGAAPASKAAALLRARAAHAAQSDSDGEEAPPPLPKPVVQRAARKVVAPRPAIEPERQMPAAAEVRMLDSGYSGSSAVEEEDHFDGEPPAADQSWIGAAPAAGVGEEYVEAVGAAGEAVETAESDEEWGEQFAVAAVPDEFEAFGVSDSAAKQTSASDPFDAF